MRVQVEGKEYLIEFRHDIAHWSADKTVFFKEGREKTACLIRDCSAPSPGDHTFPVVALGEVVRHFKDQPNREKARKWALKAALEDFDQRVEIFLLGPKPIKGRRRLFWDAYHARKNGQAKGKKA